MMPILAMFLSDHNEITIFVEDLLNIIHAKFCFSGHSSFREEVVFLYWPIRNKNAKFFARSQRNQENWKRKRVKNIINTTPLSLRVLGNVCVDIYCSCTEFALWVLMVNFKNICIILWQRKPVPR